MAEKGYLLAYDIRDPRRLRRVHRYMLGWGTALQYSVFAVDLTEEARERMMVGLAERIMAKEDDVRLYRMPSHGGLWSGRGPLSEGIILTGSPSARTLSAMGLIEGNGPPLGPGGRGRSEGAE